MSSVFPPAGGAAFIPVDKSRGLTPQFGNGNMMSGVEALIGKTLGTCTIQSYTGIGRMGIVYLAVQSSPRRDVALKIVPPVAAHTREERTAFAARFLRKSKALAALQHPHVLPVYDFGIEDGLAYLVMPYIRSGTLFDLLNREGTLSLANAARYLEQLAAALHYAHMRGITHGDVTPSNILLDADRRALMSDFALTGIATETPMSQMRLLRSNISLGSLEYLAPEQIMGESIGPAADIYALGILLFQMLTGQTPFHDSSPISLAAQQVQAEPPAPRSLRPELPAAAEQVILRALAKGYTDRFNNVQEMAAAFRAALGMTGGPPLQQPALMRSSSPETPRADSLFAPAWQNVSPPGSEIITPEPVETRPAAFALPNNALSVATERQTGTVESGPSITPMPQPPTHLSLRRKARMLRVEEGAAASAQEGSAENPAALAPAPPTRPRSAITDNIPPLPATPMSGIAEKPAPASAAPVTPMAESADTPSRELPVTNPGTTGTMKLTATMKIVQVPVAGQPGRYVTGLLPVLPEEEPLEPERALEGEVPLPGTSPARAFVSHLKARAETLTLRQKTIAAALVVLIIISGSGALLFARGRASTSTSPKTATRTSFAVTDAAATSSAQATATAKANVILVDALSQNIHNWPIAENGSQLYFFADGAYHIFDNAGGRSAPAFLPGFTLKEPLVYSLTMDEMKGNDSSINNSFGMILFFSTRTKSGHSDVTFYSFEVVNAKGGQYQFWKYDSSKAGSPWTSLWHHGFGREFHQGQGPKNGNAFTVAVSSGNFTFLVNGKKVGFLHDGSFNSGEIGMLVNLKGTEVAFSNLQLKYNL